VVKWRKLFKKIRAIKANKETILKILSCEMKTIETNEETILKILPIDPCDFLWQIIAHEK
jgi:hypothetical protein